MTMFSPGVPDFNALMKMYQDQQGAANTANESRYRGILGVLQNQGATSKQDIQRTGAEERGGITQSMIDRGLYSSSVMDSLKNRSFEAQNRASSAVDESVADRTAGVMERRTDQGPNLGLFSSLLGQAAGGLGSVAGQAAGQNSVGRGYAFGGINQAGLQSPGFGSSGGGGGGGGSGGGGGYNISSGGGGGSGGGGETVHTTTGGPSPVGSLDRYLYNINQARDAAARQAPNSNSIVRVTSRNPWG